MEDQGNICKMYFLLHLHALEYPQSGNETQLESCVLSDCYQNVTENSLTKKVRADSSAEEAQVLWSSGGTPNFMTLWQHQPFSVEQSARAEASQQQVGET